MLSVHHPNDSRDSPAIQYTSANLRLEAGSDATEIMRQFADIAERLRQELDE